MNIHSELHEIIVCMMSEQVGGQCRAQWSILCRPGSSQHRPVICSSTVLNVGHLRFGSTQNPTCVCHCVYVCKTEQNRLEAWKNTADHIQCNMGETQAVPWPMETAVLYCIVQERLLCLCYCYLSTILHTYLQRYWGKYITHNISTLGYMMQDITYYCFSGS